MAKVEKESAVEGLRHEMKQMAVRHDTEANALREALQQMTREKETSEMELRSSMRRQRIDHDDEASRLKTQVKRLTDVHKEAMDAGTLRARQILFWDSVKGGHPTVKSDGADSSLTWRAADEGLVETVEDRSAIDHHVPSEHDGDYVS